MNKKEVFERIKEHIAEYAGPDVPVEDITLEANLQDDLAMDSLDMLLLAGSLEEELPLQSFIQSDEFENWQTVDDVVKSVAERL